MRSAATVVPAALPQPKPRLRAGMIPRSRLVRSLVACRDTPLATVVAPPGYGKSTLLTDWEVRDKRPFRWLSAEEATAAIGDVRTPQVIVVDDAHAAAAATIRSLVKAAGELPDGAMLALAARRELALPIGRLRAHRLVLEITTRELAMSRMEAAMLLGGTGIALDAAQVDLLVERTEGWPAPLYLAALSLAEQADDEGAVAAFSGADRLVVEYLDGELLAALGDEERAFLRRTSVLTRLTGELCDAVLGADESAALLHELRRAGIPLEPLDRHDFAFRHHRLLGAMLQAELARMEPELPRALHQRAADWYARHGEPGQAVRHAVAGHDAERAGRLLWSVAPRYASEGQAARLGPWLEPFANADLSRHPALALATTTFHLAEGRRDQAEHALASVPEGEHDAAATLLRACIARHGAAQMGADAARAGALGPADAPWQSLAMLLVGVGHQLTGDAAAAREQLENAAGRAAGHADAVAALCQAQLALMAIEASDWDDAERRAHEAHATLEHGLAPAAVRALVLAVYAVVASHRGDVAQARHDATDARRLLAALTDVTPWLLAEAHLWLARCEIRLSDGPAARALLARAARIEAQVPDAVVLTQWVHDGWERADALAESATGTGPTLTNAELRVLRLLPSHLSFREIGERLHVSTNTVKTQALAVYRKLDVSSRSEAVSLGRSAGLIDG